MRHTTDARRYLDRAGDFLRRRPVEHSVLLTVAGSRVGRPVREGTPDLWLWVEQDDEVVAAAMSTPPFGAYVSTGPAAAVRLLTRTLRELRPALPDVGGLRPGPDEFAAEWRRLGGGGPSVLTRMGVYEAVSVQPPPSVPGRVRPAGVADVDLLHRWETAFGNETGSGTDATGVVDLRLGEGTLFVWEHDRAAVSMAATTPAQAGVVRVNLVYTPAELRRRGFASALVAAVSAQVLATPGHRCMLFTDLDNPTSNAIYQAIGYRRVGDAVRLALGGG